MIGILVQLHFAAFAVTIWQLENTAPEEKMKSLLTLGLISFALAFCGLSEKLKQLSGGTKGSNSSSSGPSSTSSAEKAELTSAQQAIIDGGTEAKWNQQGLSWKLPSGWQKIEVMKESFNYSSPDNAFLLVNISVMPDSFPMDVSKKANYDQAMQQLKNGKYESVRMLEINGIEGVEFTEASPEEKDGIRRHQWIAYRTFQGQKQQLNVMTSTKNTNFVKHVDDFIAILYSMKTIEPSATADNDNGDPSSGPSEPSSPPTQPSGPSSSSDPSRLSQDDVTRIVREKGVWSDGGSGRPYRNFDILRIGPYNHDRKYYPIQVRVCLVDGCRLKEVWDVRLFKNDYGDWVVRH